MTDQRRSFYDVPGRKRRVESPFWCYGKLEEGFVPVQGDGHSWGRNGKLLVGVRREIAEAAYECYARRYGTSQSFDRLHERGGFGVGEMLMLLVEDMPLDGKVADG